jgi:hypothetical protein
MQIPRTTQKTVVFGKQIPTRKFKKMLHVVYSNPCINLYSKRILNKANN